MGYLGSRESEVLNRVTLISVALFGSRSTLASAVYRHCKEGAVERMATRPLGLEARGVKFEERGAY